MMTKTRLSHKAIAMFLIATFLPTILPVNHVFASNSGPTAPEAASFEPVDATDMVNLATGDFSYVLPLLNVPSPEGGYPLSLSYHAGIALDQEASWVGLGWSVNPGALSRNVSGVPDDWKKGQKSKISFDRGGTITYDNVYAGVGVTDEFSVGLNASWVTNKAFGGETNTTFNLGGSVDYRDRNSGNSGSVGISNNGLSFNFSYDNTNNNFDNVVGGQSRGTGISLQSQFNVRFNRNSSRSDNNSASQALTMVPASASVSINADFGLFRLGYSRSKYKYWSFDEKTYGATGSLYSGSLDEVLNPEPLYYYQEFDSGESLPSEVFYDKSIADNNPSFAAYDNYNIDAQGLNGTIAPKLLQTGRLHTNSRTVTNNSMYKEIQPNEENSIDFILSAAYNPSLGQIVSNDFTKEIGNDEGGKPHFYFQNKYSSFLKHSNVNIIDNYIESNGDVDLNNLLYSSNFTVNEESDGYDTSTGRLRRGEYISTFTNEEISNNSSLILEAPNFDRSGLPEDGIGAFRVTAMDGKTYHYSIPVYQKEKFSKFTKSDQDISNKYIEEQSLYPYATHWLLTAVTGPDFVDNGNDEVGEDDLGYWVRFDYGKWTDGYSWRMPKTGFNYSDASKSYTWGVKDIYYLNSITTRTHTALFVKELRSDNRSVYQKMQDISGSPIYKEVFYKSYDLNLPWSVGSDNNLYFPGAYSQLGVPLSITSTDTDMGVYNWFYANTKVVPSLALKEIILLKNENVPQPLTDLSGNSGNTNTNFPVVAEFLFEEEIEVAGDYNDNVPKYAYLDNKYRGEYYNNLLDENDYNFKLLKQSALKVIDFGYTYSLGKDDTFKGGKLTLERVLFKGKNDIAAIPPYKFKYYLENIEVARNSFDDWGYRTTQPWLWSISEIQHPLGGDIKVEYESDEYFEKSVASSYLDANLQVKFEGTNSGNKYVSIRQNPEIEDSQEIDFRDLYPVNTYNNIDIQYYRKTSTGSNWIADVATSCRVEEVTQSSVKFQIPTNSNQSNVRVKTDCQNENWVFYQNGEFNHVVDETNIWKDETMEWNCDWLEDNSEKVKIRIFFNQNNSSQLGGGLRAKKVILKDGQNGQFETAYYYNKKDLNTGNLADETSGTTSYAPARKYRKDVPYKDFLPSPGVLYENVRIVKEDDSYIDYQFNVINGFSLNPSSSSAYSSNILNIDYSNSATHQGENKNRPGDYVAVDKMNFEIKDMLSSLGRLISTKQFNSEGHLLKENNSNYFNEIDLNEDFVSETYVKSERVSSNNYKDINVNLTATTYSQQPSVVKSLTEINQGFQTSVNYGNFDLQTGQETEIITTDSRQREVRNKVIPAYTRYPGMASKVDDPTNSNMLSQTAVELMQVKVGNEWKTKDVNITTWNNDWEYYNDNGTIRVLETNDSKKIWRKHQSYVWRGALDQNGLFQNYNGDDNGFVWGVGSAQTNQDWLKVSGTELYNHYSAPLEINDVNDNEAATKYGENESKVYTVANSSYDRIYYSGAEDPDISEMYFGGGVQKGTATIVNDSHTGSNSLSVSNGQTAYNVVIDNGTKGTSEYKISLWAKTDNDNHLNTRIKVEGVNDAIIFNQGEIIRAGNWAQLSFYTSIAGKKEVYVTTNSGSAIVDDFRIHPIHASLTSYVYNEWDELTHIIGPNNMAVEYKYDKMGRLEETFTEVADFALEGSGGFRKSSEHEYTYKYQ